MRSTSLKRWFNHSISLFVHGVLFAKAYNYQQNPVSALQAALLSFALVWLIMVMVMLAFRIQCGIPFPERWFRIHKREAAEYYELLGVKLFRWLLLNGPFRFANQGVYIGQNRSDQALERLLSKIKEAEFAHVIDAVLTLLACVIYQQLILWLLLWNLVFNIYPILLQRYHRIRIEKVLKHRTMRTLMSDH